MRGSCVSVGVGGCVHVCLACTHRQGKKKTQRSHRPSNERCLAPFPGLNQGMVELAKPEFTPELKFRGSEFEKSSIKVRSK